jgi:hypothetical protein
MLPLQRFLPGADQRGSLQDIHTNHKLDVLKIHTFKEAVDEGEVAVEAEEAVAGAEAEEALGFR